MAINIDTASCEELENNHGAITGVLVHVQSAQPVAVPLDGGTATLGNAMIGREKAVAILAPIEPGTQKPWIKTMERGTLVVNIGAQTSIDLLFVFDHATPKSVNETLQIAGLELPFAAEAAPVAIETRKAWSLRDPRVLRSKTKCITDAQLSASGDRYEFGKNSSMEFVDGEPVYWCPGAKHTWMGRSRDVLGVFSVIASSDSEPLRFGVTKDGYEYRQGRGYLRLENGKIIRFPGTTSPRASVGNKPPKVVRVASNVQSNKADKANKGDPPTTSILPVEGTDGKPLGAHFEVFTGANEIGDKVPKKSLQEFLRELGTGIAGLPNGSPQLVKFSDGRCGPGWIDKDGALRAVLYVRNRACSPVYYGVVQPESFDRLFQYRKGVWMEIALRFETATAARDDGAQVKVQVASVDEADLMDLTRQFLAYVGIGFPGLAGQRVMLKLPDGSEAVGMRRPGNSTAYTIDNPRWTSPVQPGI